MDPGGLAQLITLSATAAAGLIVVLGVTVRFALGPVMKAKRLAAAAAATPPDTARLEARMGTLEEELRQLGETVERVAAVVEFDNQLRSGEPPQRPLPPGGGGTA